MPNDRGKKGYYEFKQVDTRESDTLKRRKTAKCNDGTDITSFQAHDSFLCPMKTSKSIKVF